ncbi:MAG: hypothetical protein ACOX6D_10625 [Thermoguttaceae bacterium]|jgi:hypothetical protein
METSVSGIMVAGIVALFGLWQYIGQKKNLRTLAEGIENNGNDIRKKFLICQARRRMQTGILFCLAGIMMFAGGKITPLIYPNICSGCWLLCMIFLLWAIFLMVIDIISIRLYHKNEGQFRRAVEKGMEYLNKKKKE